MSGSIRAKVQCVCQLAEIPSENRFHDWAQVVDCPESGIVCIRIVDEEEMTDLNRQYRNRPGPTDVLAFPADSVERDQGYLGDVAICAPVVLRQAASWNAVAEERFAQVTVHGLLHLLGHDHLEMAERQVMESLEARFLDRLGYSDPYREAD